MSNVHIPKEIEEALEKGLVKKEKPIIKVAYINWDGGNFLIRVPKEIARISGLTKENVLKRKISFKVEIGDKEEMVKTFDIIKRTEPKRRTKKHGKNKEATKKR